MQPADLNSPLTDAELEELDALLLELESDTAILSVSELDGFLTAVVSGPEMVPPSKWLPVVWGDETLAPVWRDAKQFEHVFGLLIRHMNGISATLMQKPDDFEALFGERVVDGKQYLVVDEWCLGYMKGVALCADAWHCLPEELVDELFGPIPQFSEEAGWDMLESLSDDEVRLLQDSIEPTVRAIHAYWLAQRSPASGTAAAATFQRETPKVGRNEPCPCGSGRKYKRCCGAH